MSQYFKKGKGWRYDFTLKGKRYTKSWFKTKAQARKEEGEKREQLNNPMDELPVLELSTAEEEIKETQTDMGFLVLVNLRLDHVKEYKSKRYYTDYCYYAKRWCKEWKELYCSEITVDMVEEFLKKRKRGVSAKAANADLRYLKACFNHGIKRREPWISSNPCDGIKKFPVKNKPRYVPPQKDVQKILNHASKENDDHDYLWTITLTLGRMSEINRLRWEDINLESGYLYLYTRKKKGGDLTPRKIKIVRKLHVILSKRFAERDPEIEYVFWHKFYSRKRKKTVRDRYTDRKKLMRNLCDEVQVKYFRFHPLRHYGASIMSSLGVPIRDIQQILGHENIKTTQIYLQSIGQSVEKAMDKYESSFEEAFGDAA